MKKKLLIVATVCASLFVVVPAVSVSAAEVESESQVQTIQNDDIGIAPCADEIVTKFRLYKNPSKNALQYSCLYKTVQTLSHSRRISNISEIGSGKGSSVFCSQNSFTYLFHISTIQRTTSCKMSRILYIIRDIFSTSL